MDLMSVNQINLVFNANNMHIQIHKHAKNDHIKKECCGKNNHRTITRYGHELLDLAEQKNGFRKKSRRIQTTIMYSRST